MIVIVDYKLGNLASIQNMLNRIGAASVISSSADDILGADKLILPGVGAFDSGMEAIERSGVRPLLNQKVIEQKAPTLGVCLGMQLLTRGSDEGGLPGLGWVAGDTVAFDFKPEEAELKIPHMGWNKTSLTRPDPIFDSLESARFYFVHSYHVRCDDPRSVLATSHHGCDVVAAFRQGNIWGTQFHPEKSHRFGMQLLKNFAELD